MDSFKPKLLNVNYDSYSHNLNLKHRVGLSNYESNFNSNKGINNTEDMPAMSPDSSKAKSCLKKRKPTFSYDIESNYPLKYLKISNNPQSNSEFEVSKDSKFQRTLSCKSSSLPKGLINSSHMNLVEDIQQRISKLIESKKGSPLESTGVSKFLSSIESKKCAETPSQTRKLNIEDPQTTLSLNSSNLVYMKDSQLPRSTKSDKPSNFQLSGFAKKESGKSISFSPQAAYHSSEKEQELEFSLYRKIQSFEKENNQLRTELSNMYRLNPFDVNNDQIILHKGYKLNELNNFALISDQSNKKFCWVNLALPENSKLLKHMSEVPNLKVVESEYLKQKQILSIIDAQHPQDLLNTLNIKSSEIEELQCLLSSYETRFKALISDNGDLKIKIATIQVKLDKAELQINSLRDALTSEEKKLKACRCKEFAHSISDLQKVNSELEQSLEKQKLLVLEKQQEIARLEELDLQVKSNFKSRLEKMIAEYNENEVKFRKHIKTLEDDKAKLTKSYTDLEIRSRSITNELGEAIKQLKEQFENAKIRESSLRKRLTEDLKSSTNTISELKHINKALTVSTKTLEEEFSNAKDENLRLKDILAKKEDKLSHLKLEMVCIEKEICKVGIEHETTKSSLLKKLEEKEVFNSELLISLNTEKEFNRSINERMMELAQEIELKDDELARMSEELKLRAQIGKDTIDICQCKKHKSNLDLQVVNGQEDDTQLKKLESIVEENKVSIFLQIDFEILANKSSVMSGEIVTENEELHKVKIGLENLIGSIKQELESKDSRIDELMKQISAISSQHTETLELKAKELDLLKQELDFKDECSLEEIKNLKNQIDTLQSDLELEKSHNYQLQALSKANEIKISCKNSEFEVFGSVKQLQSGFEIVSYYFSFVSDQLLPSNNEFSNNQVLESPVQESKININAQCKVIQEDLADVGTEVKSEISIQAEIIKQEGALFIWEYAREIDFQFLYEHNQAHNLLIKELNNRAESRIKELEIEYSVRAKADSLAVEKIRASKIELDNELLNSKNIEDQLKSSIQALQAENKELISKIKNLEELGLHKQEHAAHYESIQLETYLMSNRVTSANSKIETQALELENAIFELNASKEKCKYFENLIKEQTEQALDRDRELEEALQEKVKTNSKLNYILEKCASSALTRNGLLKIENCYWLNIEVLAIEANAGISELKPNVRNLQMMNNSLTEDLNRKHKQTESLNDEKCKKSEKQNIELSGLSNVQTDNNEISESILNKPEIEIKESLLSESKVEMNCESDQKSVAAVIEKKKLELDVEKYLNQICEMQNLSIDLQEKYEQICMKVMINEAEIQEKADEIQRLIEILESKEAIIQNFNKSSLVKSSSQEFAIESNKITLLASTTFKNFSNRDDQLESQTSESFACMNHIVRPSLEDESKLNEQAFPTIEKERVASHQNQQLDLDINDINSNKVTENNNPQDSGREASAELQKYFSLVFNTNTERSGEEYEEALKKIKLYIESNHHTIP